MTIMTDRVNIDLEEMKPSILEFASELRKLNYQGEELSLKYLSKNTFESLNMTTILNK